jgi:hypothetical protein
MEVGTHQMLIFDNQGLAEIYEFSLTPKGNIPPSILKMAKHFLVELGDKIEFVTLPRP